MTELVCGNSIVVWHTIGLHPRLGRVTVDVGAVRVGDDLGVAVCGQGRHGRDSPTATRRWTAGRRSTPWPWRPTRRFSQRARGAVQRCWDEGRRL